MPFGEVVCGAPGSGKSTYCYGKHQLFTALQRPISIVSLDPANENIPYPCAIDISSLITLQDAMDAHGLGPNGGMLYCMEYLEANFDWLESRLNELGKDAYVLFDIPGQVEVGTNHESLKRIIQRLSKIGFRLAAVHLCDAHYVTDAAKYVSVLLLSLRTMLQLELPHINVLSKIDLLSQYGDLDFNLDFYTEVQDLSHLENALNALSPRFTELNMALISVIEDFGLVGFETLAVEVCSSSLPSLSSSVALRLTRILDQKDKASMLHLSRAIDRATGYIFVPPKEAPTPEGTIDSSAEPASARPNTFALFSTAAGSLPGDVRDVQERWIDAREAYDAYEKREWMREGEIVREQAAAEKAKRPEEGKVKAGGIRERK
ncbi:cytoplasmic protein [Pisolithus sp. B1]|nr:cytoplasmic protein [Pisolithus sp. B1]